jgi:ketosteroid isomerase-like protein
MRRQVAGSLITVVFAVLLGSCAASQKPVVDAAAIKTQVADVNQKFLAAVTAKDIDAVVNTYSSDARSLPANMARADGHDAIRTTWGEFLKTPGLNLAFTSSDVSVSEAGDIAIDVGAYEMTSTGPKGEPMKDVGKYVTIFKKVGDEWKIAVDTFNSDAPLAAPVASK